ncbi:MAG: hypothetical protein ACLFR1_01105 [Spirochaetia bacterium]
MAVDSVNDYYPPEPVRDYEDVHENRPEEENQSSEEPQEPQTINEETGKVIDYFA